jgi:eukaryotic-like serine/threonine-protein kinase
VVDIPLVAQELSTIDQTGALPPTATDPLGAGAYASSVSFNAIGDAPGTRAARPLPPSPLGYELRGRLGGGGMGDVYLAYDQMADRLVAMKFIRFPGDPELLERFLLELRVLAQLDHPNIVRVLGHDFHRADPYFTMEYLEHGSLTRKLEGGPLAPDEGVRIIRAVAGALSLAHAKQVIHRDVKPSNVLLTPDGTPKLADFGLARRLDEVDPITQASGGAGTPNYMPPEQISKRNGALGPWSDVYGLGATLYHLLTGRAPFVGDTPPETIRQVLADPPPRPRKLRPNLSLGLEAIVLKCLEKDPKDRYQTVADLVADLDNYEAGQRTTAREMTRWRRTKRWARRQRIGLGVAVIAVVVGGGLTWAGRALAPVPQVAPPSKTAEELKAERLQAIYADLRAGKSVTLVGETGEPLWYEAPSGTVRFAEHPVRTEEDPGGCFFYTPIGMLTVLKLLDPPLDHYRIKLQLKHVAGPKSKEPALGFFAAFSSVLQDDGWNETSFLAVGYSDRSLSGIDAPVSPSAVIIGSRCYASAPGRLPNNYSCNGYLAREPLREVKRQMPGPWRSMVVEASPERLLVFWDPILDSNGNPTPTAKPLADLSVNDIRSHRRIHAVGLRNIGRDLRRQFAPLPDWSPHLGIGVWATEADVAVKNVVLSPL